MITLVKALSLLVVSLCLVACGQDLDASGGQVVATVNGREISVHQVQARLQSQPMLSRQLGQNAGQKVVQDLVEQELAAQAARDAQLENSPKVLQAMELAKREVLARAYEDQLADKAMTPTSADIETYYDQHPELFQDRRHYRIQELTLNVLPATARALIEQVKATNQVSQLNALIRASGVSNSSRELDQWAENMPMVLLKKMAALEPGQSLVMERAESVVIATLIGSERAPVSKRDAAQAIHMVLMNERRRLAVEEGMQALRKSAKIKLTGSFAASAASVPASR